MRQTLDERRYLGGDEEDIICKSRSKDPRRQVLGNLFLGIRPVCYSQRRLVPGLFLVENL